ncbi:MAG: glycerol kinase GlpK [Phycisphaerales bacterium]
MARVLALDEGTTSCRAIVFDDRMEVCGSAQREFEQHFPRAGWVEHDAEAIWSAQRDVMEEAIAAAGGVDGIRCVGITNQRETTVVWDRSTGEPIHRALVWQDRRTARMCDGLREAGHEALFAERTGLVVDAYFSGTKVRWVLDHVEGARARAEKGELAFGTIDSWLIWKLTGGRVHATDVTNASRTLMWNIHTQDWDDELLGILGVPRSMLPEVVDSSGEIGRIAEGLPGAGLAITGVAGDQQAALAGQLCVREGMAKNTYGTGCFLLLQTGESARASSNRLLTTAAWRMGGAAMRYALEGSVFVGGAVVQWLRDGLGIIGSAPECDRLGGSVEDSGGVVMVPAFVGLGAPHWDQYARGAILGITRGTTRAHLCRAALESIAFSVAELLDAMRRDAGAGSIEELRADGGAAASDLLLQMQADLVRAPVVRPKHLETTAVGAAFLAGLGGGVWGSFDDLESLWEGSKRFEPSISADEASGRMARWRDAVERSKGWASGE